MLGNINAEGLANVIERELITNYSTLVSIVSNRRTLLRAKSSLRYIGDRIYDVAYLLPSTLRLIGR